MAASSAGPLVRSMVPLDVQIQLHMPYSPSRQEHLPQAMNDIVYMRVFLRCGSIV